MDFYHFIVHQRGQQRETLGTYGSVKPEHEAFIWRSRCMCPCGDIMWRPDVLESLWSYYLEILIADHMFEFLGDY